MISTYRALDVVVRTALSKKMHMAMVPVATAVLNTANASMICVECCAPIYALGGGMFMMGWQRIDNPPPDWILESM